MSLVTNVIISTYYESERTIAQIENFEWEVRGEPRTIGKLNNISNTVDGTHHSNGLLYNTGLNYFPIKEFYEYLNDIEFYNPESVVVICRLEGGWTSTWSPKLKEN